MYSLYFYLLIYCCITLIISKFKNSIGLKVLNIFYLCFLTVMIGFRYNVGTDYLTYEMWYYYWNSINIEWFYTGISAVFLNYNLEFYHLTIFLAVLSHVIYYLALKNYNLDDKEIIIALIIYSTSFLFLFMNTVRQGMAIIFLFWAISFFIKRKYWKFFLIVLLGAGFHISIVFMIPICYFLKRKFIEFKLFLIGVIISYIIIAFGVGQAILMNLINLTFYSDKYENSTLISTTEIDLFSLGVLTKTAIALVISFIINNKSLKKEYELIINLYLLGSIIRIFAISTFLFNRIGFYMQFFEILAVIIVIQKIKNKYIKLGFSVTYCLISFVLIYKTIVIDEEIGNYVYKWVFDYLN